MTLYFHHGGSWTLDSARLGHTIFQGVSIPSRLFFRVVDRGLESFDGNNVGLKRLMPGHVLSGQGCTGRPRIR